LRASDDGGTAAAPRHQHRLALRPGRPLRRRGPGPPGGPDTSPRDRRPCAIWRPQRITDVATMPATSDDKLPWPGFHARLEPRACSRRALVEAVHLPGPPWRGRARATGTSPGRLPGKTHPPAPPPGGLRTDDFRSEYDRREVTDARPGKQRWHGPNRPLADAARHRRPLSTRASTKKKQKKNNNKNCPPCHSKGACTTSGDGKRTWAIHPPSLRLQVRNRATSRPRWTKRYAVRFGIEGHVCEFARGHGMRNCATAGQAQANSSSPHRHRRKHRTPQPEPHPARAIHRDRRRRSGLTRPATTSPPASWRAVS